MKITKHAKARIKQRIGISGNVAQKRFVELVLQRGLTHAQLTGSLEKYISALYKKSETANGFRLYGRHVYIFRGQLLITVIHLPKHFHGAADKMKRKHEEEDA